MVSTVPQSILTGTTGLSSRKLSSLSGEVVVLFRDYFEHMQCKIERGELGRKDGNNRIQKDQRRMESFSGETETC